MNNNDTRPRSTRWYTTTPADYTPARGARRTDDRTFTLEGVKRPDTSRNFRGKGQSVPHRNHR